MCDRFSLNPVCGGCLTIPPDSNNWLEGLGKDDSVLRRLEMIRLVRSGVLPEVVAGKYGVLPEFVLRLDEQFKRNGVVGILTDEDFQKFRSVYPETIGICTFNLHGMHDFKRQRLENIARNIIGFDPALCAFQEVISGPEIKDTAAQISEWMSKMTGHQYRSHYVYCHLFMEKYPEGVAVSSRHRVISAHVIDMNKDLWKGLRPLMDRYAAVVETEIYGRRIVFASVHLDHADNPEIRQAQGMKLLSELEALYGENENTWIVLAGDFNDVEDSPVIEVFKKAGFRDTYRECNSLPGFTYTSTDPHKRIDFILLRGDAKLRSSEVVLESPDLSDHKGVFTLIQ
jgi:endonuclease/exonuclease/phosphatase family metal-dependent hydrolase